jgi:hypothetical protein
MVDRDIGDAIRRDRAGDRSAVGTEEAGGGVEPRRRLDRGLRNGDARVPGGDTFLPDPRGHARRRRRAQRVALDLLDAR